MDNFFKYFYIFLDESQIVTNFESCFLLLKNPKDIGKDAQFTPRPSSTVGHIHQDYPMSEIF
jgi:hypothetical protein